MRTLNILCGICVLLLAVHFTHLMHHVFVHSSPHSPLFWVGMVFATIIWILSFIGGCLLLRQGR